MSRQPSRKRAVRDALEAPGRPLEPAVRTMAERRFGQDLGPVQVHDDQVAARAARATGMHGFTFVPHVVLGRTHPDPARLLLHELTHVLQQRRGRAGGALASSSVLEVEADAVSRGSGAPRLAAAPGVQGARFTVGRATVQVDYGDVASTPVADVERELLGRISAFTSTPAIGFAPQVAALTSAQRRWMLYAVDVLADNTPSSMRLDRPGAVTALLARAPASTTAPGTFPQFEREVLEAAGWFEVALTAGLPVLTAAERTRLRQEYRQPPSPAAPSSGAFDRARFDATLPVLAEALLATFDPANWGTVASQSISDLDTAADEIQRIARHYFAPYADTAASNRYRAGWTYSPHLHSTSAVTTSTSLRLGYLRNRLELTGRLPRAELASRIAMGPRTVPTSVLPTGSVFADTNFRSSEPSHRTALEAIAQGMEARPAVRAMVDRLIRQTGRARHATGDVWVRTDFDASRTSACEARWRSLDTLCHELVHVLVHPQFPSAAHGVEFPQVVREGFTEVLGVQLYEHLRSEALKVPSLRTTLEAGISGGCTPPHATIGYGDAGTRAERIRKRVGDDRFRAAYLLGRVDLVGL